MLQLCKTGGTMWDWVSALTYWLAHIANLIIAHNPWIAGLVGLLVGWVICPGFMYFLAIVSEWRWPKYRDQFKAFMPGNIFLGMVFGCAAYLASAYRLSGRNYELYQTPQWVWIPLIVGVLMVLSLSVMDVAGAFKYKEGDTDKYHWRQLVSWTKIWHNVGVYGAYGYLLIRIGVPGLFSAPSWLASYIFQRDGVPRWIPPADWLINDALRLVLILALARWVGYLIADVKDPKFTTGHVKVNLWQWLVGLVVMAGMIVLVAQIA